jgi:hypothetical protein
MNLLELADQAVALAMRGIPVFPCRDDKSPLTLHGFRDAVSDPKQARALFLRYPGARLVGIVTGLASGLTIVDIDPDGFPWMSRNLRRLEPTQINQTRRGYHLVYQTPDPPVRNSVGVLARGVDIRGEGGCCTYWPAVGLPIRSPGPPAPFPKWIIQALARIKAKREAAFLARSERMASHGGGGGGNGGDPAALERFVSRLGVGTRNQGVFWAACRAGETGLRDAEGALVRAAMTAGLDAIEATRTVRSGLARGRGMANAVDLTDLVISPITHVHCPRGCEHPQPFFRGGKRLCGRCWFIDGVVTEVVPCAPPYCTD